MHGTCFILSLGAFLIACSRPTPPPTIPPLATVPSIAATDAAQESRIITVVATNDIHGHLERLPAFGGLVSRLRQERASDGAVVLVDAGDMWQGTIASNADEGASMVRAFGVLGYDAVTIGNHEFDYGPVGERVTPRGPDDDPLGALRARAAEAPFPFLNANLRVRAEAGPDTAPAWDNVAPSMLIEKAGVLIGLIGVTTEDTLHTTIAANVATLTVAPLAEVIASRASELRERGATLVVVLAHAGGECSGDPSADPPKDISCHGEIIDIARDLPHGSVDLIAAGHTHQRVVTTEADIPIVESGALGTGFARVDFEVRGGRVVRHHLHRIQDVCAPPSTEGALDECHPPSIDGRAVQPDEAVRAAVAPALRAAEARITESLGRTQLTSLATRAYREESALGNLLADWMHEVRPRADVALLNAGGVRADLPEGPLTYGRLYEAFPFDNRFATVSLTGAELRAIVSQNLQEDGGILLGYGFRVTARCDGTTLMVELRDARGRTIADDRRLTLVTSDYLATTPAFGAIAEESIVVEDGPPMRDLMADHLRTHGGATDPARAYDPSQPRWTLPTARPLRCSAER